MRQSATALDATYIAAIDSLRLCCSSAGIKASGRPLGHHQVWARDSMIALLGARFAEDNQIQDALRVSLALLKNHRGPRGAIPNNVDPASLRPNFRAYADGGLWWIAGSALVAPDPHAIREILGWYECQDVDGSGLLSMQEASDWQDLFCTRGKGLYLNCLYVLALRLAAKAFEGTAFEGEERDRLLLRAAFIAERINAHFWYAGDKAMGRHFCLTYSTEGSALTDSLGRPREIPPKLYLTDQKYYLPYLGFRAVGEWFDSFGNLLAILAGVASPEQSGIILDFISRHFLDRWPLCSLTPAVQPGDPDWRNYYGSLNTPHRYHNGGVWPFLGGFYVAALVQACRSEAATRALLNLAELNRRGQFNEWHHGETGEPMGAQDQAWSAGMYLFACECVKGGQVALP